MGLIDVDVKELIETRSRLENTAKELHGRKLYKAIQDCILKLEGDAKRNLVGYQSPEVGGVDTGRLRASILPSISIDEATDTILGIVGTNVHYAPYVEFGTQPHWPPIQALEVWARRHHTTAFIVARSIARRGTYAKEFLRRAYESNLPWIQERLRLAVEGIIGKSGGTG